MRIIVFGGTGFLGKHLQRAFQPYSKEHQVKFLGHHDCDMLDYHSVENLLFEESPDVIVHAAAVCGGIKINSQNPARFISDNLQMGINLFNACQYTNRFDRITYDNRKSPQVKKVYTLGSVCAYPKHCPVPFKEDDLWNGFPEETNAPYGIAKRALLTMGQAYRQQYGIGGAHLIPVNLYGEYDHFDLEKSHVIPALINKFVNANKRHKKTVTCWGSGLATREFLYAGDAATAIVKAVINELDTNLPINLGTGKDISIKDLAVLIQELTGFSGKTEFTGEVSDGQPKRRLDCSRAKELLNFEATTELKEGITKTIVWYQKEKYG